MRFKLKQPSDSGFSRSELCDALAQKGDNSVAKIQYLLNKCDSARFGMMATEVEKEALLKELQELI